MGNNTQPIIMWFRQDLRLKDNPALLAAHHTGCPILPVYILDDETSNEWKMGAASRWWLHESLKALDKTLEHMLCLTRGPAQEVLQDIIQQVQAKAVYWNRCFEPWRVTRDQQILNMLEEEGIQAQTFNGSLLFEPHTTRKANGLPYKVFTPFYKKGCLGKGNEPRYPQKAPQHVSLVKHAVLRLRDLELLPSIPWHTKLEPHWQPGEVGADARLKAFLKHGLQHYQDGLNYPGRKNVSRLSPHLHFGEISPHQVWYAVKTSMSVNGRPKDGETFLQELGWREFSHHLLYHYPDLPQKNLQKKFNAFPWRQDRQSLKRWQTGQTGYPIVDAEMRELWETGYMHNRVRMIVGSFLVKNLLLHWHHGRNWFWDTLVDADLANNSASWQWIAGCGADAAPYFRIFNPVTQGRKFDEQGEYVKTFVPELARLPLKYLHCPWEAPAGVLQEAGITLGHDYPFPIVDLPSSRARALAAFSKLSNSRNSS